jgi:hypothetical protein
MVGGEIVAQPGLRMKYRAEFAGGPEYRLVASEKEATWIKRLLI